jgi:hypothetical protein
MAKNNNKKRQGPGTGAAHNVFISWSGDRSKAAAQALREWLPDILQAAKPWMSGTDIEKGSVWLGEIGRALDMKVGIICLTRENLGAEWILFEAGALSKTFDDDRTRVCTYLLGGLHPQDLPVKHPLGMFQSTRAEREETRKMVHSVNRHLGADPVPEASLDRLFDKLWPDLEARLEALPKPPGAPPPSRPLEEMVADVLELVRAMSPVITGLGHNAEAERKAKQMWSAFGTSLAAPQGTMMKLSDLLGSPADPDYTPTTPAEREERNRLIAKLKALKKSPE